MPIPMDKKISKIVVVTKKISQLKAAEYNPRKITTRKLKELEKEFLSLILDIQQEQKRICSKSFNLVHIELIEGRSMITVARAVNDVLDSRGVFDFDSYIG